MNETRIDGAAVIRATNILRHELRLLGWEDGTAQHRRDRLTSPESQGRIAYEAGWLAGHDAYQRAVSEATKWVAGIDASNTKETPHG